jgi:hypothetical protein
VSLGLLGVFRNRIPVRFRAFHRSAMAPPAEAKRQRKARLFFPLWLRGRAAVLRVEVQPPPITHDVPLRAINRWLKAPTPEP